MDQIKEKIGYLKIWLGVALVTTVSLASWIVVNLTFSVVYFVGLTALLVLLVTIAS